MSKYVMRKLKGADVFKMSRILKKMNLKLEVGDTTTQMEMGVQFIQRILENMHLAESEICEFLSELVGTTPEELSELPLDEFLQVVELFKQQEGLVDFLKRAGR